jgi:hypothetical protein
MNIVDLIKNNLSGDMLGQLGSLVGASPEQTKTAAGAAVPAILAGLGKSASTTAGADRLSEMLNKLDPNMVNNPGSMLGGGEAAAQKGAGMLDSILGGNLTGGLGGLLGKFSGLGSGVIGKLLGYLAPIIMGVIAKSLGGAGKLNPQGLSSFFAEQQQNISNAMPAGFSLANIPGMGDVGAAMSKAADSAKQGASTLSWLLPVLLLGLAVALWLYYRDPPKITMPASTNVNEIIKKGAEATLGDDVKNFFSSATETFTGIKDAASAEAALPKLKELDEKVDGMKKAYGLVPEAGKAAIKTLLGDGLTKLKDLVAKITALPGVGEKIKPVVDGLMAKLTSITG